MKTYYFLLLLVLLACESKKEVGSIEKTDEGLDAIIKPGTAVELLAEGFVWSEGPVWVESEKMLLFSDVPKNNIYKWTEKDGLSEYLTPSGYTQIEEGNAGEGSNGLLLNASGQLVICQHGDRRMASMESPLNNPSANFKTLAATFEGKRFNSPNDAAYNTKGELFFTDPPYGLSDQDNDKAKEIKFNGVYRLDRQGVVSLLVDSLTRPNGIAFINDSTFIVANSDKDKAKWYEYSIRQDSIISGKVFYDATTSAQTEKGLPDGLKISSKGIVFATGPGGVWIFDVNGKLLGKIKTTMASANCALDAEEKTLYITSHNNLLRVQLQ
ncbi:SMP-30/gluconolactonase/LRE family protein [Chryseotalea sanaruensis]|uniref:SMP-30/gluconolactonase/LRE family protein n=1 Tax=Chryseotalea sanaruensis TaxID=2482724 RepID=A0A401UDG1_9BACT|nr:SMP-30/gluconolactonase/LRE family protein [Chryseotalea sanaruensis]GCC52937.1 SMP-30/gluconolactonase/LRE family protein [Chryseotalea sanaruensis]